LRAIVAVDVAAETASERYSRSRRSAETIGARLWSPNSRFLNGLFQTPLATKFVTDIEDTQSAFQLQIRRHERREGGVEIGAIVNGFAPLDFDLLH